VELRKSKILKRSAPFLRHTRIQPDPKQFQWGYNENLISTFKIRKPLPPKKVSAGMMYAVGEKFTQP
jgi:hypothetical protein